MVAPSSYLIVDEKYPNPIGEGFATRGQCDVSSVRYFSYWVTCSRGDVPGDSRSAQLFGYLLVILVILGVAGALIGVIGIILAPSEFL